MIGRIEVIGLPGSGKSTLVKEVCVKTKLCYTQKFLYEDAAYYFLKKNHALKWIPIRNIARKIAKMEYFASDNHSRVFLRNNPTVGNILSEWLQRIQDIQGTQYLARLFAVNSVFTRANLIDTYRASYSTLLDEHWTQLIAITLSYGDVDEYFDWLKRIMPIVPLPDAVVWLSNASDVFEKRQIERGKVAAIFYGSQDMEKRGDEIERRLWDTVDILKSKRVPVLILDSKSTLETNVGKVARFIT